MTEQTGAHTGSSQSDLERLERLEAKVNRILQMQRLDDLTFGEIAMLRSTQSNTCSSASTGGCHIEGRGLATPTG